MLLGGAGAVGLMAVFSSDGTAVAGGPAGMPRVHRRRRWRAKAPRRAAEVLDRAPNRIIVHHTATPNSADYSLAHAFALSRSIQRFHMEERGWDDIGEQLTISRGGHIMEGRNRSLAAIKAGRHVVGAQTLGHNRHTIGIENEGTYLMAEVPVALWEALADTCAWLCKVYRLDPYSAIRGHRDFGATSCPGDVLYARLPELRLAVAARLTGAKPTAGPPITPTTGPSGTVRPLG